MTILLDTNALIWWLNDDRRLGKKASQDIASSSNKVYVSNLALFECVIKQKTRKLDVDVDSLETVLTHGRIQQAPFDVWSARQFLDLPRLHWADPFDTAFMAQAIARRMTLMTSDGHILASGLSDLRVIDARK